MASLEEGEIEIQDVNDVQIQEIEIEQIQVDLPIETVETSDDNIDEQPIMDLHSLPEPSQEEIVLQTSDDVGDHHLVYVDGIPAPEIEISTEESSPTFGRRFRNNRRKFNRNRILTHGDAFGELTLDTGLGSRRWEQKQVQIRTLEGEFSVTMWASGKLFCLYLAMVTFFFE